jgi:hypothetical protein
MGRYHARYVREHYIKRDIKRELYEAFIEWCGERSINTCLEKALSILRGNITVNVRGNTAPNTANPAAVAEPSTAKAQPVTVANKAGAGVSGGYEWCRPRSSIKNLEGFVEYLERSLGLEDWWEEDDKICFRTRVRPAKT